MTLPKVSIETLANVAHDNPRRNTEGLWDYLDRLCVLAGALKPGEGRLPKDYAFKGSDDERERVRLHVADEMARLPYKDAE